MQINWEEAVNKLFEHRMTCPRCERDYQKLTVGYSRKPSLNRFAPRHRDCPRGDDCDARKLVTLCGDCARIERFRGGEVDAGQVIESYLLDCRRDLEESLDYLAEYWRDDFDLSEEELDRTLEQVDPEAFREEDEWRRRHEEEYLRYHREFRSRSLRIPQPGWRAEYVEEIRSLGYETALGD
jgi:hypothetical protein